MPFDRFFFGRVPQPAKKGMPILFVFFPVEIHWDSEIQLGYGSKLNQDMERRF